MSEKIFAKCIKFLNQIGIETSIKEGTTGFVKNVEIREGKLFVDPSCSISSLLHEAGHVALLPVRFRGKASGDMKYIMKDMQENIKCSIPEMPEGRAALQYDDCATTAWAWAVGKHLKIPEEKIILDEEYQNTGEEMRIRLKFNSYFGISGLAAAGFCVTHERHSKYKNLPLYPKLKFWTQQN